MIPECVPTYLRIWQHRFGHLILFLALLAFLSFLLGATSSFLFLKMRKGRQRWHLRDYWMKCSRLLLLGFILDKLFLLLEDFEFLLVTGLLTVDGEFGFIEL